MSLYCNVYHSKGGDVQEDHQNMSLYLNVEDDGTGDDGTGALPVIHLLNAERLNVE